ncbi:hypothetical protein [Paenimyroides viscosum]|uniref:Lipoprotein n=1 Tax=Paenimyroides viscosum TaxID=2488729 RepID=A0A3P1B3N4_9FLAO|nr:hypothetical protein [Paenimyroides viscosum]RRA95565.1 hypothetical protein EG242_05450 [Paenimyroides viscosum]
MKKLKLLSIIAIVTFIFSSCDPEYCSDYSIYNNTQNDIELFFYGEENSNKLIEKGEQFMQSSFCGMGKSYLEYYLVDSVQIKRDGVLRKTYYPSDEGKSIYKTQDRNFWKLVQANGNYSKFVFEINEEDLQ